MKLVNQSTGITISKNARVANTFWGRFLGLMFAAHIDENEALIISPCNNIHMFFMNFGIDVLFIDREDKVCYIQEYLKPGQISKYVKAAKYVIELPEGRVKEKGIRVGDKIE